MRAWPATAPGDRADRLLPQAIGWRRPVTGPAGETGAYKEWMHFCVQLPEAGHLIVNLNVTEALLAGRTGRSRRLIALACAGGWSGALESFDDEAAWGPAGRPDVRLGQNRLAWRDGGFDLVLRSGEVSAELRLAPALLPTAPSSAALGSGRALHWVIIPRLEVSGWVELGGRRLELERSLAYHDHNWGHFRWGGDLAWDWGFAHPADPGSPWTLVFARVSDQWRHRTLSQTALLWKGGALVRNFQNAEIGWRLEGVGALRGERPFTLPRIGALLAPGSSSVVPQRLVLTAEGQGDRLEVDFESLSRARIAVPSEADDFRLMLLNEVSGRAQVKGSVLGEALAFTGAALVEMVGG